MSRLDILPVIYSLKLSRRKLIKLKKPTLGMILELNGISQTLALLEILISGEKKRRVLLGYKKTKNDLLLELAELFVISMPQWINKKHLLKIQDKIQDILSSNVEIKDKEEKPSGINKNWAQDIIDFLRFNAGMSKQEVLDMYMDELVSTLHNIQKERQEWAYTLGVAFNSPQIAYDQLQALRNAGSSKGISNEELKKKEDAFLDLKDGENG